MGLRTSPMSEWRLVDWRSFRRPAFWAKREVTGDFTHSMEWSAPAFWPPLGHDAAPARNMASKYARDRRSSASRLENIRLSATKIADMAVRLETGRLLVYKAAWLKTKPARVARSFPWPKLYGERSCVQTVSGWRFRFTAGWYTDEYQMERDLRDRSPEADREPPRFNA